jgi:hypothetical protein
LVSDNVNPAVSSPVTITVRNSSSGGGGGGGGAILLRRNQPEVTVTIEPVELQSSDVADPFTDLSGHWAASYIEDLRLKGMVNGTSTGIFSPNLRITRGELAKMVVLLFGFEFPTSVSADPFRDVDSNMWYAPYIDFLKNGGIMSGYSDGTFRPNNAVSRAEALKTLLTASRLDITTGIPPSNFPDIRRGIWYAQFVDYAKANSLIDGYPDGTFKPTNSMTRAEFAKIADLMLSI